MTYLYNDPDSFASDALHGLQKAFSEEVAVVHGGIVRATETPRGQVALVLGGGSGHYPAFAGWVGPGMGHGAVCGKIFSSPSASQVYSVARNVENGGGVILGFGNYAGDVLHFGLAAEKLRAEGIDVRIVRVSDDIVSASQDQHRDRRGIAGDFPVFKIVGAAIEAGLGIDEAERVALKANDATRSFGIAFDGCTLPGADAPLFHVQKGLMGVGLGIHGEPGIRDEKLGTAAEIADMLVDGVLAEQPIRASQGFDGRIVVLLNGLGRVKYEELFVVYDSVAKLLESHGLEVVKPEVGEFVTSLDMAGLSLTVVFLDDELERYWLAPADTLSYRRGVNSPVHRPLRATFWEPGEDPIPQASSDSRLVAQRIVDVLESFNGVCIREEAEFGRIDAIAGDGDHGQGMKYGSHGALEAARAAVVGGAGARTTLVLAGQAWAESAGGTSGALWGAALTAAAGAFSDSAGFDSRTLVSALSRGIEAMRQLGGAQEGDKTLIDAALPFRRTLDDAFTGENLAYAINAAANSALTAAYATSRLVARKGRSRVLAEKSVGTPDPGAVSFSLLMQDLGESLK